MWNWKKPKVLWTLLLSGITKEALPVDYQSPGRCCNIPSVINKMIHNAAHGAAFMIHSFFFFFFCHGISILLVCLLWKVAGNVHTLANTHKHTRKCTNTQRYICGCTTVDNWHCLAVCYLLEAILLSSNMIRTKTRSFPWTRNLCERDLICSNLK